MSSGVDDILSWNDNDFQKTVDFTKFVKNNRAMMQSNVVVRECAYCGKKFALYVAKKGRPPIYCSDECRDNAVLDQSKIKSHKYYHKHKHEMNEKQRWGLGSGTLGQHRHKDFAKEEKTIKKELTRLRIKSGW